MKENLRSVANYIAFFIKWKNTDLCSSQLYKSIPTKSQQLDLKLPLRSTETTESDTSLCLLCCTNAINVSFIHGKVVHQFWCSQCAKKLLSINATCPICRRKIKKIVKLI